MAQKQVYVYASPDLPHGERIEKLFRNRDEQLEAIRVAEEELFNINLETVNVLINAGRYDLFTVNWDRIKTQMRRGSL